MILYPVMDGVYCVSADKNEIRIFLSNVFERLACLFNKEAKPQHQFLVKGAVAFGPVIHGSQINAGASNTLDGANPYKDSILIGMPMVFAVQSEPHAPPFGVFVHESARSLLEQYELKKSHCWWPWFSPKRSEQAKLLRSKLPKYFAWCEQRAGAIGYDISRIHAHKAQAAQYLVDA